MVRIKSSANFYSELLTLHRNGQSAYLYLINPIFSLIYIRLNLCPCDLQVFAEVIFTKNGSEFTAYFNMQHADRCRRNCFITRAQPSKVFLKKLANPGLFFVYFWSFQTNITIFTTIICEKCPSSIWCRDSNPQPLERESLPITTRPGLPPILLKFNYEQVEVRKSRVFNNWPNPASLVLIFVLSHDKYSTN